MIISTLPSGQVYADDISSNDYSSSGISSVLITHVQLGGLGSGTTKQELVEFHNAGDTDVDVTSWCVTYSPASDSANSQHTIGCLAAPNGFRLLLPKGYYFSFVTNEYRAIAGASAGNALFSYTGDMAATSGHIRVLNQSKEEIDKLAWGSAVNPLGAAARSPESSSGKSLQRVFDQGVFQHTASNGADFATVDSIGLRDPSGALETEIDECINLPGNQHVVPNGYIIDDEGLCVEDDLEEAPIEDPDDTIDLPENPVIPVPYDPMCEGVVITEILPNPAGADAGKEYIELWNVSQNEVNIKGCSLQTSGSNRLFTFEHDEVLLPNEFRAYYDSYTGLTLPNSAGATVWFLSLESEVSTITYAAGLTDDVAWAQFSDGWFPTFVPTPGQPNIYAALKPCAEGYERNLDTNRCGLITAVANSLASCGPGQERNPETNRCRNILSSTSSLTPCREGQYRNPETNRCRNIESASSLAPCREGQERNPDTNRCRAVVSNTELADCGEGRERNPETNRCRNVLAASTTTEPYAVSNTSTPSSTKTGWLVAGVIFAIAAGYGAYEWRHELGKITRRFIPGKK